MHPHRFFESSEDFQRWLAAEHPRSTGVWLKLAKKASGISSVTYFEALDVALCFGWIDAQKNSLDANHWVQRFTPRKPKSRWSKINRTKALALIASGRMRPAGQREIDAAKADGRWKAAYASQSKAAVPRELRRALDANPAARAFFATLDSANRYAILYRVAEAKKAVTRAARIAKFVAMLAEGKTLHPPRKKAR